MANEFADVWRALVFSIPVTFEAMVGTLPVASLLTSSKLYFAPRLDRVSNVQLRVIALLFSATDVVIASSRNLTVDVTSASGDGTQSVTVPLASFTKTSSLPQPVVITRFAWSRPLVWCNWTLAAVQYSDSRRSRLYGREEFTIIDAAGTLEVAMTAATSGGPFTAEGTSVTRCMQSSRQNDSRCRPKTDLVRFIRLRCRPRPATVASSRHRQLACSRLLFPGSVSCVRP